METITPRYSIDEGQSLSPTTPGLIINGPIISQTRQLGWPASVTPWLLAATVLTAPITYSYPTHEFGRSQSSSLTRAVASRPGQRISLREARQLALQISAETDSRLAEERRAESRFLSRPWEDESADA